MSAYTRAKADTYAVRSNHYQIRSVNGLRTLQEAIDHILRAAPGACRTVWKDGTHAFYLDPEDMDSDDTGEHVDALACLDD